MRTAGIVLGSILGLVLVVALAFGGRELGWWLKADNINRQVKIDNTNTGTQTAWRDEARNAISDYELVPADNLAARGSLRNKACTLIDRLVESYRDEDLVTFEAREC